MGMMQLAQSINTAKMTSLHKQGPRMRSKEGSPLGQPNAHSHQKTHPKASLALNNSKRIARSGSTNTLNSNQLGALQSTQPTSQQTTPNDTPTNQATNENKMGQGSELAKIQPTCALSIENQELI